MYIGFGMNKSKPSHVRNLLILFVDWIESCLQSISLIHSYISSVPYYETSSKMPNLEGELPTWEIPAEWSDAAGF